MVGEQRAEDLIQETATRALEKPPRHDQNLQAWMKRIAKNLAMSESRKNKIRRERVKEKMPESYSDGYSTEPRPDRSIEAAEATADLLQVIGQLPAQQRIIVLRRFQHEVSIAQISKDLGISELAVQKTIERARANCKKVLRSRHGNGWAVPCLLVIQQPNTLAPIAPTLGTSSASSGVLSSTAKIGLGVAAGLALAVPMLLPSKPVEASTQQALPLGAVGAQAVGGSAIGFYSDFQPDQRLRVGGMPSSVETSALLMNFTVVAHDADGTPIENVPIRKRELGITGSSLTLRPDGYFDANGEPEWGAAQAVTDSSGRAKLSLLIDHDTQLLAAHPDYRVLRTRLVPIAGELDELRIELTPAARVKGQVVDQFGTPVVGVKVAAHLSGQGHSGTRTPEYCATTDSNGDFQMVALKPDSYEYSLSGEATATTWSPTTELKAGLNSARLEIRPGHDVVGEVFGQNGERLSDARVWLVRKEESSRDGDFAVAPRDIPETWVDPQTGRFVVHNALLDGEDRLLVRAHGYLDKVRSLESSGGLESIVLEKSSFSLDVQVFRTGEPVEDAIVQLDWNHGNGWDPNTRSRLTKNGLADFELADLGPNTHFDVTVIHAEGSAFLSSQVLGDSGKPILIDLQDGTPVTLRIVDSAGSPVPNFRVPATASLNDPGAMEDVNFTFVSDAQGECIWRLPDSTLSLSPQVDALKPAYMVPASLSVSGGIPVQHEIVLHPTFARSFRVSDENGQPIRKRRIEFRDSNGSVLSGEVSGDDGRLRVEGMIPGSYVPLLRPEHTVTPSDVSIAGNPIELDPSGPKELELVFSGLHSLKLRVEMPTGLAAPDEFALVPHPQAFGEFAVLAYGRAVHSLDENGQAELGQLLPGVYWLMLPKQANRPAMTQRVRLPLTNDSFVWRIPGTRLSGTVQAEPASTLAGQKVRLVPIVQAPNGIAIDPLAANLPSIEAELDGEGNFSFPFVPTGEWELLASPIEARQLLRHRVSVGEQTSTELQLGVLRASIPGTLRIELSPRRQSRLSPQLMVPNPAAFALLNLETQTWFNLTPDENGRAERNDLPIGQYQLYLFGEPEGEVRTVAAGEVSALLVD